MGYELRIMNLQPIFVKYLIKFKCMVKYYILN